MNEGHTFKSSRKNGIQPRAHSPGCSDKRAGLLPLKILARSSITLVAREKTPQRRFQRFSSKQGGYRCALGHVKMPKCTASRGMRYIAGATQFTHLYNAMFALNQSREWHGGIALIR